MKSHYGLVNHKVGEGGGGTSQRGVVTSLCAFFPPAS